MYKSFKEDRGIICDILLIKLSSSHSTLRTGAPIFLIPSMDSIKFFLNFKTVKLINSISLTALKKIGLLPWS